MAAIVFDHVSKRYGALPAVDDLCLEIRDKEFFVILGPSGAGKTTTLKMVAGIEPATGGTILLNGRPINHLPPEKRDVAMVFESYALYSHLTVFENIAFPCGAPGKSRPQAAVEAEVQRIAGLLGLGELLDRRPSQLSGGQRQRVALGRSLIRQPAVFLMDEPLSHLDAKIRTQMRAELKHLRESINTTILYVTHDYSEALSLADRIAFLYAGRIQQVGTPHDIYHRPANRHIAESLGDPPMNFLDGVLWAADGRVTLHTQGRSLPLPAAWAESLRPWNGCDLSIGIRPQHLRLLRASPGGEFALPGRVFVQETLGDDNLVSVVPDRPTVEQPVLMVLTEPNRVFPRDGPVHFTWQADQMHLFAKDTGQRLPGPA